MAPRNCSADLLGLRSFGRRENIRYPRILYRPRRPRSLFVALWDMPLAVEADICLRAVRLFAVTWYTPRRRKVNAAFRLLCITDLPRENAASLLSFFSPSPRERQTRLARPPAHSPASTEDTTTAQPRLGWEPRPWRWAITRGRSHAIGKRSQQPRLGCKEVQHGH